MKIKPCLFIISITAMAFTGCASKTEREIVNGCKASGADASVCKCIYKKLEKKYGEDGLRDRIYNVDQSESFQHDAMQATFQCANGD